MGAPGGRRLDHCIPATLRRRNVLQRPWAQEPTPTIGPLTALPAVKPRRDNGTLPASTATLTRLPRERMLSEVAISDGSPRRLPPMDRWC